MRSNYWSCSKFADWLRGTNKPPYGTSQEWADWRKLAESTHKFRYWLAEEGLDYVQKFFMWIPDRLNDVRYYINNRWVSRAHALTASPQDIKPGKWCDLSHRMLPCLFNELVNFVEIELAWHHVMWDSETAEKYNTPWWRSGWLRWRTWRCPEAGIAHLEWSAALTIETPGPGFGKPTSQAEGSQEILALYKWWVEVYRNRPDPLDASGLSAFYDRTRDSSDIFASLGAKRNPEEQEEYDRLISLCTSIEFDYDREEEEMMIRLIKVRQGLWT